ncbi:exo-alpha-sialidase [Echinicola marina]|uniref:exo-alpha-sialidase n=1 Tax=Echinicola marina TaxID=2859768 RepID=UPI001CF6C71A|nr:exo-alpha-sialidase [Echinicola marina]UCS93242.1 exo-alpha-sialidase [Echinicola marina]
MRKGILHIIICLGISIQVMAQSSIEILEYKLTKEPSRFYNAIYTSVENPLLRSGNYISVDNGKTWKYSPTSSVEIETPPKSGRRAPVTSIFDSNKQLLVTFFNSLDNPQIPKHVKEPKEALKGYYLRYRTSSDNGKSWLYDIRIKKNENSNSNPFSNIVLGRNAFYLGDYGSKPIINNKGHILLPVQATVISDSKCDSLNWEGLYNPTKGYTYTEVIILRGKWKGKKLVWKLVERIIGDPNSTTRGLIEPSIIKLNNGNIFGVFRGSNGGKLDSNYTLPGYKWYSFSRDNGKNWTKPRPWTYDDGSTFYSPSSMSVLFKHSNGKLYWVGNISEENPKGNHPRFPLVIGEVDQSSMKIIKSSVLILDTYRKYDEGKNRLDLGHVTIIEDRVTKEIIIVYPRLYYNQKEQEWVTIRLSSNSNFN